MRVFTPTNLAPIRLPNPYWTGPADPDANGQPRYVWQPTFHDPLIKMGFDECLFAYNGTCNEARIWASMSGDPMTVTGKLDWTKGAECSYPPRQDAVQALANLAANPAQFQWPSKPFMPIIFDIEDDGSKDAQGNSLFAQTMYCGFGATPEQRRIAAGNMVAANRYVKAAQGGSPVGWYGFPSFDGFARDDATEKAKLDIIDALKPVAAESDIACPSMYFSNANGSASNPDLAIVYAKQTIALIRAEFPTLAENIVAVLSPAYQIFWNDPKLTPLQGQPIPLPYFRRLVDVLNAEQCDAILWADNLTWGPQFAPLAQYLASKR